MNEMAGMGNDRGLGRILVQWLMRSSCSRCDKFIEQPEEEGR